MKIGIIGAGHIGSTLAALLTRTNNEVVISNSRGPETLSGLVESLGPLAQAGSAEDAAIFGDLVIEAIPFGRYQELPREALEDKILVTASNYYPQRDGQISFDGKAQSELIAEYLVSTRVVKAFNTIWYQHLQQQGDVHKPLELRRAIFLAGDDADAKQIVADLIIEIGFGPIDTGSLHHSSIQEPGSAIYNRDITVVQAEALLAGIRN